ncbi:MAG: hypothetical protein WAU65_01915 [Candidatus Nanoarchaeia archaeon]
MKEENQKIQAVLILEVIGKPQKYLIEILESLITQMSQENGVKIKNKSIKEPKKMEESASIASPSGGKLKLEEQKDFYVDFAEVEVETDTLIQLILLMFKYMPAHVEIITPESISIPNHSWNEVLNDLIRKLHGYDEIARVLQVEKAILENKLKATMETQKVKEDKKPKKTKKKK